MRPDITPWSYPRRRKPWHDAAGGVRTRSYIETRNGEYPSRLDVPVMAQFNIHPRIGGPLAKMLMIVDPLMYDQDQEQDLVLESRYLDIHS
jgi:hypothetical protein